MPPLNAKNISEVRDEYDRVSKIIGRFSLIRATIIGIAAFVLASGLSEISSSEVNSVVADLKKDFQITQVTPDFNDAFLSAIYGRSFQSIPHPDGPPEETTPVFSDQEKKSAQKKQDELVTRLKAEAQKAFDLSFNAPLLGTKIDIDLGIRSSDSSNLFRKLPGNPSLQATFNFQNWRPARPTRSRQRKLLEPDPIFREEESFAAAYAAPRAV